MELENRKHVSKCLWLFWLFLKKYYISNHYIIYIRTHVLLRVNILLLGQRISKYTFSVPSFNSEFLAPVAKFISSQLQNIDQAWEWWKTLLFHCSFREEVLNFRLRPYSFGLCVRGPSFAKIVVLNIRLLKRTWRCRLSPRENLSHFSHIAGLKELKIMSFVLTVLFKKNSNYNVFNQNVIFL